MDLFNVSCSSPRSPALLGKTSRGGGKYSAIRVIKALAQEPDDDGLTVAELAAGLGIRRHESALMCGSAWKAGLLMFDVIGADVIYKLTDAGRDFGAAAP